MKKTIGILGVVMIAMTMFFNVSLSSSDNINDNLVTLTSIASANADGGERYKPSLCSLSGGGLSVGCLVPETNGSCDRKVECGSN